ncbi:restriction endonuclease subunit S [Vibrio vulnificus]|uniref:restriction endonuclease subunit S n=1 Tax=Vibrio vulnificus TaxID=672 RepID=UPI001E635E94|nr:restriction endonuclease subunit S [Vibrio vulnificus]MCU8488317.1 restriction endonuclease subunit S [Vibrio vulnificus]MCU8506562.1 restriction endonuclease subunit S [Vibrio vulnificus]
MSELPKGWVGSTIGEACLIENGLRKPISLKERAGCQGDFPYYGATGVIDYLNSYTHEGEYVLIGEDGANLLSKSKPLAFIANGKYWVNNHAHTLRCLADSPNLYLEKYFNSLSLESWVTGSAQPKLTKKNLESIPYPLAPLAEQKRIVEKLDEVLAQVDTIKARLDGIPALLKRFRQSVLASAVSGKLTEEWRASNEHNNWKKSTLGELVKIDRGSSPRPIKQYITDEPEGVNWVKIGDATKGGKYILQTEQKITKEGALKSRKVIPGDFILSNSMSLGLPYIMGIEGYVHDGWFVLRLPDNLDTEFFYYLLSSNELKSQFTNLAVGGVVKNIRSELVKEAKVQLPTLSEQKEIVRLVDQYFAFADTIEAQVKKAQARVDNLTQSILAKAFRGELVPQDPNDEPADKLLERIAEARKEAEALAKTAKKAEAAKKRAAKSV